MSAERSRTGGARRESSAGGVVFRMEDGKPLFLLIRDSYANWGFPKGHLETGERPDIAALREVTEETGLQSLRLIGSIATIEWYFRLRGTLIHKDCHFFLMESDSAATKPQKSEGITDCRWATVEEAHTMIAYENAREVLTKARQMVIANVAPSGTRAT